VTQVLDRRGGPGWLPPHGGLARHGGLHGGGVVWWWLGRGLGLLGLLGLLELLELLGLCFFG